MHTHQFGSSRRLHPNAGLTRVSEVLELYCTWPATESRSKAGRIFMRSVGLPVPPRGHLVVADHMLLAAKASTGR